MRYCCVPLCTSSARKKEPTVSFHEVPADVVLRQKWIKMISRKDWEPNTTSNYSVVCSKHFVSSDFKENTKIRQLKKGAVPSVFAGYPSYMCSAPPKQCRDESSRKRALQPDYDKNRTVKRAQKTTADTGDAHLVDCTEDSVRASVCDEHVQLTVTSACASPAPTSSRASMSPTPVSHIAGREESIPKRTAAASSNSSAMVDAQSFAKRAFATQTEKTRTSSSGFVERRKWRAKEQALRLQISRLKETVDKYKEELRKLKEDCNVSTFLDVVAGAEQKNVRAVFLLDQITNYNSKTDMV